MSDYIKKNIAPIIIGFLSIAFIVSAASAQNHHSKNRFQDSYMSYSMKALKHLDLTDDQKDQMKTLFGGRDERKNAMLEFRSQSEEVRDLIEAGDFNAAAEVAANLARERVNKIAETKLAMESILTPDQLEKLKSMQAQRRAERQANRESRQQRREDRHSSEDESTSN